MSVIKPERVDYETLDNAKAAFIQASRKTLTFANSFGFLPDNELGASANIFALDLKPFLKSGADKIYITLVPEGLGTADDARPDDLSDAEALSFWHNIAIKTVATMTNDVASSGMQPVLLSLYLPSSTPKLVFNQNFMNGFLDGIVSGCKQVGCVYFSGETPELRGKFHSGIIDIAGAVFGLVPSGKKPINPSLLNAGNQIILVESSGPHENGFTTLRTLAEKLPEKYRTKLPSGQQFWQAINAPSKLYTPLIQAVLASDITPTSVEPITGHGWQKLMRSKKSLRYVIEQTLPVPEIFSFIEEKAPYTRKEMLEIFNYGAGLAIFVKSEDEATQVIKLAKGMGLNAIHAGYTTEAPEREVVVAPFQLTISGAAFSLKK